MQRNEASGLFTQPLPMNTRTSHKTQAIVLRTLDYGESDCIVTFYTRDFGKLRGIAKGARRSRKRFANALELFNYSDVVFSRRGRDSLAMLEESRVLHHFEQIRQDLNKTLMSSYLIDLTNQFTTEDKINAALFELLYDFLVLIDGEESSETLLRFFEMRLLVCTGYEPVLDRCVACQAPLDGAGLYAFHARAGGIRCEACWGNTGAALLVSPGTVRTLLMCREMEPAKLKRLTMSEQSARESRHIMLHFIQHLLGRELKSLQVLHQIRRIV
jgi:DNA repair protein RecO (recombination protein O)